MDLDFAAQLMKLMACLCRFHNTSDSTCKNARYNTSVRRKSKSRISINK